MSNRVTIQDIADALSVSRNTVSKAINNTGILADATREKVLKKAIEMGYKQFSYVNIMNFNNGEPPMAPLQEVRELALFTTSFPNNSHFASTLLDKFQKECSQLGYNLTFYCVREAELNTLQLPFQFDKDRIAGIICIEMFDYDYSQMLCDLEIPILFVDCPVVGLRPPLKADILIMDNQYGIYSFINEMVQRGKTKIGFIGDIMHCQSFQERYLAYRNALHMAGLPYDEKYCLTGNKKGVKSPSFEDYREYLTENIQNMYNMHTLPDVFLCVNDFAAIDVLDVFKKMGISVPKDIYLCGFDDSPESRVITPTLTTIHIHSRIMGFSAVHLLMSRIKEPSLQFRTIHTETELIYRESTED